jgi:hypothetical protein
MVKAPDAILNGRKYGLKRCICEEERQKELCRKHGKEGMLLGCRMSIPAAMEASNKGGNTTVLLRIYLGYGTCLNMACAGSSK